MKPLKYLVTEGSVYSLQIENPSSLAGLSQFEDIAKTSIVFLVKLIFGCVSISYQEQVLYVDPTELHQKMGDVKCSWKGLTPSWKGSHS